MNHSKILQRMCHDVLGNADLKAIAKSRGFPAAAANPGIMAGLFLTEQGLAEALASLDRSELALLHLLKTFETPVNIAFFEAVYPSEKGRYLTFTQKNQSVLSKVKQQLVRKGVLLMWDVESTTGEAKMALWRFAFPLQFHSYLPPLFEPIRTFDQPGNFRSDAFREKLQSDLMAAASGDSSNKSDATLQFKIVDGQLHLGPSRYQAKQLPKLQIENWNRQLKAEKKTGEILNEYSLRPAEAVSKLLSTLPEKHWVSCNQLQEIIPVFTGRKIDCDAACEAGWQVGALAKLEADGTTWFRPAPAEPIQEPHKYLNLLDAEGGASIVLSRVPLNALETLVELGDVRLDLSGPPALTLSPNLIRLGRAGDEVLTSEQGTWLFSHSPAFARARDLVAHRRGKTIVHSNVMIARVTDLSLRLALEKALGDRWISLSEEGYAAFPPGALMDVQRVVKKSGHVIKEGVAK